MHSFAHLHPIWLSSWDFLPDIFFNLVVNYVILHLKILPADKWFFPISDMRTYVFVSSSVAVVVAIKVFTQVQCQSGPYQIDVTVVLRSCWFQTWSHPLVTGGRFDGCLGQGVGKRSWYTTTLQVKSALLIAFEAVCLIVFLSDYIGLA